MCVTHTLHYGMGVFEGVCLTKRRKARRFSVCRITPTACSASAHILQTSLPFSKEEINAAHLDVVKANGLKSCYFRPMAFYGSGKLGVAPKRRCTAIVAAWPWAPTWARWPGKGIRVLKPSSFTRHHVNITMCKGQGNGNYMNPSHNRSTADGYDDGRC